MISINFLLLRKISYSESSMIYTGISPDTGLITFMHKGIKRKKQAFQPDLFQELIIESKAGKGEMYTILDYELVRSFSGVSSIYNMYKVACNLSSFIIKSSLHDLPCPVVYRAALVCLHRLANSKISEVAIVTPFIFAFLFEHGLLPDNDNNQEMLECAYGERKLPAFADELWYDLYNWSNNILKQNDYQGIEL